jgi:S-adenosylmethionine uptake transporter
LGTIITILGPILAGNGVAVGAIEGNLLIVLALIVDTIASLYVKILAREDVPAPLVSHVSFIIGFIIILPITIAVYSPGWIVSTIIHAPPAAHLGVLYMAVLSGTLAYALRSHAVKTIELSEAAVFSYLYPLWAAPLALLWLSETITLPFVIGAILIATGVILAERKKRMLYGIPRRR